MTNANQDVVSEVDALAEERFSLEVEKTALAQKFKSDEAALKASYQDQLAAITARIGEVDAALLAKIKGNRAKLIAKGKQSFVTLVAKFQFKKASDTDKVKDADGVMAVARKLGVVRQIAKPVREYKLDRRMFGAWLKKHPEYRDAFAKHLEERAGESLTMQPNGTYMVTHDSKRISPPSVSIKPDSSKEVE